MLFLAWLVIYDLYLFHLIVILNPALNFSKSVLSFSVDKVTTGTYNFVAVIWNVAFVEAIIAGIAGLSPWAALAAYVVISVKIQLSDQFKVKNTLQLIKGMSKFLQKLLKCFNGTTIFRFFLVFVFLCTVFSSFSRFSFNVFPIILLLYLKDWKFVMGSAL